MSTRRVSIDYYTDLLCIWAYVAEVRVDELRKNFPGQIEMRPRCVPIFGDTAGRIEQRWRERGGFEGYARHVKEVARRFDPVEVHPDIWLRNVPAGSFAPHVFVKAAALLEKDGLLDESKSKGAGGRTTLEELIWRLRLAFFRDLRDIARLDVQLEVAATLEIPQAPLRERLENGSAAAALAADHEAATYLAVTGSPTYVLDGGRQKLYGNIGYLVIEANIQELLRDNTNRASWC